MKIKTTETIYVAKPAIKKYSSYSELSAIYSTVFDCTLDSGDGKIITGTLNGVSIANSTYSVSSRINATQLLQGNFSAFPIRYISSDVFLTFNTPSSGQITVKLLTDTTHTIIATSAINYNLLLPNSVSLGMGKFTSNATSGSLANIITVQQGLYPISLTFSGSWNGTAAFSPETYQTSGGLLVITSVFASTPSDPGTFTITKAPAPLFISGKTTPSVTIQKQTKTKIVRV